jgi:hypothetical protein
MNPPSHNEYTLIKIYFKRRMCELTVLFQSLGPLWGEKLCRGQLGQVESRGSSQEAKASGVRVWGVQSRAVSEVEGSWPLR